MTLRAEAPSIEAAGGTGTLTVTVNRECAWEARAEVDWITLASPRAGQGNATVGYQVSSNPQPSIRRGSLIVNETRVDVTQSAAACTLTIDSALGNVGHEGGSLRVRVAGLTGCAWTATSQVSWIRVASGATGSGNGEVMLEVAAAGNEPRTGMVMIAGQPYTVAQAATPAPPPAPVPGCAYNVGPSTQVLAVGGGNATVSIVAPAGCAWTATSTVPWLTVSPASGAGPATLTVSGGANSANAARTGGVVVAGRTVLIVQDAAPTPPPAPPTPTPTPPVGDCTYTVTPPTQTVAASGGSAVVNVAAASGCGWTATTTVDWLIVAGSGSGGSGTVTLSVAPNPTNAARTGSVVVAGRAVQITQEAAASPPGPSTCTYDVSPPSVSVGAAATNTVLTVASSATSCTWTATSAAPWVVPSPSSGAGAGQVAIAIAANDSTSPRTTTVTIAGKSIPVTQAGLETPPTCTFTVAPTSQAVPAAGAASQVMVTASASTCTWTAQSGASWMTITSGAQGTGSGVVAYQVLRNETTSPRSGTLTIAGQVVTVTQEAAAAPTCTITVAPTSQAVPAEGAASQVTVTASATTCTWTAQSGASWITITSGPQGTGSGVVAYQVLRNETASPRSGTLTVAGQVVTVTQEAAAPAACTYQLVPPTAPADANGGDVGTRLETAAHCGWTAASQASWITIAGPASGTGSADIRVTVAANTTSAARTGTVVIAGQTFQVTQAGQTVAVVPFSGRIAGFAGTCPIVTFKVMGQDIVVDSSTQIAGGSCSGLQNGVEVSGEGQRLPDGSLRATRVEIRP